MSPPERLGALLPGVLADLAQRHGINPPTTLTDRTNTMKFRKKPVVIDAIQWLPDDDVAANRALGWLDAYGAKILPVRHGELEIFTLEDGDDGRAKHVASPGDWIIRGVKGEFYACKPDIFEATYEPADGAA